MFGLLIFIGRKINAVTGDEPNFPGVHEVYIAVEMRIHEVNKLALLEVENKISEIVFRIQL